MKKNVLLVVLPYLIERGKLKSSKLRSFKAFPYGLLSIATYLKNKAGDKTNIEVLDCNFNDSRDFMPELKKKIAEFKPDIVGMSMMFDNSYKHVKDISSLIKKYNKKTIIVLGGMAAISSHATILAEQKNIDAICFYEGEIPMLKMIESKDTLDFIEKDVSWITRKSLKNRILPQKTSVENLDEVVSIDYNFVDISNYAMREAFSPFAGHIENKKQFFLVTSRGCPFRCVFCMHSADKDKSMRYANVDAIIKHVKFLVDKYGMNVLTIYDDQILLNKARAKQLFKEFSKFKLRIECPNGLSVAFMDNELIGLMKKAGMDTVNLAIESGSPHVLNDIIHKPLKLDMVAPVVKSLRKHGFWIHGFFVNGIPGESDKNREETAKFIKKVGLDWSGFSLAVPIRGSDLYRICIENGYIKKDMEIDELDANKFIINTPEYSANYVTKKTYMMNLDVNFVHNYRMKTKDYAVAAKAFKDVIARYEGQAFAYYYLSKALHKLKKTAEAEKAYGKYEEIIKNDKVWKEYAEYFKLK